MIPIDTEVTHPGHGRGRVIARNTREGVQMEHVCSANDATVAALAVSSFYPGDKYPNVVLFDSGYMDVYADQEVHYE